MPATLYSRLLLTACTLLLLAIAVELHLNNRLQAAALARAATTPVAQPAAFRPVATALRYPAPPLPDEIRVRIIGYEYDGARKDLGRNYSYLAPGLPVMQK